MQQTVEIKITGFAELNKVFETLPDDIAKKVGIAALRKGARPILNEAKKLVPVDTGRLRDSLEIASKKASIPVVKVQASRRKGGYHAHLVELGTRPHDIQNVLIGNSFYPVVHHPGTVKNPFLRPALLNKKLEAIEEVFKNIFPEIEKQFKRALKK